MKFITIKLLMLQLKKAKKARLSVKEPILASAYDNMIQSYQHSIMFLEVS